MKDLHNNVAAGDIAFQGVTWAYSYMAAKDLFPKRDLVGFPSGFHSALDAVRRGAAAAAVIPIENTVAGRVADVHELLPQADLTIVGEHYLPIRHCLAGVGNLGQVRDVYSHTHALNQCRDFIRSRDMHPHVFDDTAAAAEMVADKSDPTKAAICSIEAAKQNGLTVLAEDVQDVMDNTTRFIVLAREPIVPAADTKCKMTLWVEVKDQPAALYKALQGFAVEGINMTKLESYMDANFNPAHFLIEIEGHPDDVRVQRALRDLEFASTTMRLLGAYPEAAKPAQLAPALRRDAALVK